MFTHFEEYAASQMLGHADSPPRSQGRLFFAQAWQRQLFGLTLAVAKQGHFEWEDFRQHLIGTIEDWERLDCAAQPPWDYYERFLMALLQILEEQQLVAEDELRRALVERPGWSSE
jgi:nitrile hydratase accessory protein